MSDELDYLVHAPPAAAEPPAPNGASRAAGRGAPTLPLRATAILLAALGMVPTANLLSQGEIQHWWGMAVRLWIACAVLFGGIALLLGRLSPSACERFSRRIQDRLAVPSPRAFSLLIAGLTCALGVFFGWLLFGFEGVTIDELSQQWQAHLLTSGHLAARAEPHGEFFSTMQTVTLDGRWFSHFPIGGPLLQAAGLLLHVPWLVNPLLAACAAAAIYRFTARIGTEMEARVTAILFALAPFTLIITASKLDHVGAAAGLWVALAALARWYQAPSARQRLRAAAVVGVALGMVTMIRPYDGLLAITAVGGFQLAVLARVGTRWRSLLAQAAAGAVPIAVLLLANRVMTGHPLTFAYDVLNGPDHRPGFHTSPLGFEHTPRHGLYLLSSYLMRLNTALLGWPVPVVGLAALVLALQKRATRWDYLLLAVLGTTFVGYFLYWGEGSFNGPRFLFPVAPVFLIYIARLPGTLRGRLSSPSLRAAVALLIPLWCASTWWAPLGLQPYGIWTVAIRAQQQDVVVPLLQQAVARRHLAHALVFIDDGMHARLTARLRQLGAPPFMAQQLVGHYDACAVLRRLDDAERSDAPRAQQADYVLSLLDGPLTAQPVPHLSAMEQLALVPDGTRSPACSAELAHTSGRGGDMARLLPLMSLDSAGRLDGDVVYARDFGARNELLRDRFPDRAWYTARLVMRHDTPDVVIAAYDPHDASLR